MAKQGKEAVREQVRRVVMHMSEIGHVDLGPQYPADNATFDSLGLDSSLVIEIRNEIEMEFGVEIPDEEERVNSIDGLVTIVSEKLHI